MHKQMRKTASIGASAAIAAALLLASPAPARSRSRRSATCSAATSTAAPTRSRTTARPWWDRGSAALDFEAFRWTHDDPVMVSLGDLPTGGFESRGHTRYRSRRLGDRGLRHDVDRSRGGIVDLAALRADQPRHARRRESGQPGQRHLGGRLGDRRLHHDGRRRRGVHVTSGGAMISLGDFPTGGTNSVANDVSDDGSVIVGGGLARRSGRRGVPLGRRQGDARPRRSRGRQRRQPRAGRLRRRQHGGRQQQLRQRPRGVRVDGRQRHPAARRPRGRRRSRAAPTTRPANGSLIVGYGTDADGQRAVIWSGGTLFDLNVIAAAVLPAGWVLEEAFGISSNGLAIVGRANNPDGNNEAFLLRLDTAPIPEPGTGALLLLGLLALAARRRR